MQEVFIDASRHEFGNAISCGLLIPHILKNTGKYKIKVHSTIDLDDYIKNQIADEYILSPAGTIDKTCLESKIQIEKFLNENIENKILLPEHFKSIDYIGKQKPIKENYVVVIPTLWETLNFKECHWRANHSVYKNTLIDLKKLINSKGHKVVAFGTEQSCFEEEMKEFSDISFWQHQRSDTISPINKLVKTQLEWMYFAKTSISFGGAFHIPFSFTVPGIGWDGQIRKNYNEFSSIISFKRNDLHYLPMSGYSYGILKLQNGKENVDKIQESIKALLYTKLNQIL